MRRGSKNEGAGVQRGLRQRAASWPPARPARYDANGDLVPMENQDRGLWDRAMIDEGLALVEPALKAEPRSPYVIQAAIAALHDRAAMPADTDWRQIVALYAHLMRVAPSPVVELNHAAALAMTDGPGPALQRVDALVARGALTGYDALPAVRADLLRRLGRMGDARAAYEDALRLARHALERRYFNRRLAELSGGTSPYSVCPIEPIGMCTQPNRVPSTPGLSI